MLRFFQATEIIFSLQVIKLQLEFLELKMVKQKKMTTIRKE